MTQWIETKVRYDKVTESGLVKKTTDSYMVDALSFTEAEGRTIAEVSPHMRGEFAVAAVRKSNVAEVWESPSAGDDRWYKAKLIFITIDGRSGTEKKSAHHVLVQARSLPRAVELVEERMRDSVADYELAAVQETAIVDIIKSKQ